MEVELLSQEDGRRYSRSPGLPGSQPILSHDLGDPKSLPVWIFVEAPHFVGLKHPFWLLAWPFWYITSSDLFWPTEVRSFRRYPESIPLGVDSFSILFHHGSVQKPDPFSPKFRRCSRKLRIPGKNGEGTPRIPQLLPSGAAPNQSGAKRRRGRPAGLHGGPAIHRAGPRTESRFLTCGVLLVLFSCTLA